jgi:hypothetical protein
VATTIQYLFSSLGLFLRLMDSSTIILHFFKTVSHGWSSQVLWAAHNEPQDGEAKLINIFKN